MKQIDRRYFLGSAGALATLSGCTTTQQPFYMPSANIRHPRKIAPDEKMNVACIGIGGKGSSDALAMKKENVVAVCDVNIGNKRMQKVLKSGIPILGRLGRESRYSAGSWTLKPS